jgi:cytidine deaminase
MKDLIEAATAVRSHAHAPYSRYHVGAAVRGGSGKIYVGANVENASYGLALCAERSAVAAAVSAGEKKLTGVAVVTSTSPPAAPCGMCRQVLAEFAGDDLPIALTNDKGERQDTTLGALLPHAFRSGDLT